MKRHIDVTLRTSAKDSDVRGAIRSFAESGKGWSLVCFVEAPDENTGKPDVVVRFVGNAAWGPIHFGFVSSRQQLKEKRPPRGPRRPSIRKKLLAETSRLLTVIFQTGQGHGMPETNAAVKRFLKDFRAFVRKRNLSVRADATSDNGNLASVIPAPGARRVFELFLSQYPLSGHVKDEERLDFFICSAFRHRAEINADQLARYLREDLEWSEKDASRVASRIWRGLDLLRVNQRFGGLEYHYFHERRS